MSLKWQTICHDVEKTRSFSASRKSASRYIQPGRLKPSRLGVRAAGWSDLGERFASMTLEPLIQVLLNDSITSVHPPRTAPRVGDGARGERLFSAGRRSTRTLASGAPAQQPRESAVAQGGHPVLAQRDGGRAEFEVRRSAGMRKLPQQ